jgi:tetratricopeptide (TPR) repeat protein
MGGRMISRLLKEKSVPLVLVFMICSIPAFADEDNSSDKLINDAGSFIILGVDYEELGKYQEAIAAYKQAIRIKPDHEVAHYNLGVLYGELGRYQEAVDAIKQSIRIKPDQVDAHYNLGVVYGKLHKYKEAVAAYKHTVRIKPDHTDAHYNLGFFSWKLSRLNLNM